MKVTVQDLRLLFPEPRSAKHEAARESSDGRSYCVLGSLEWFCDTFFDEIEWAPVGDGEALKQCEILNGAFPRAVAVIPLLQALRRDIPKNSHVPSRYTSAIANLNDRRLFEAAYKILDDYLNKPLSELFDLDISQYFPAGTKV
jgi:hypothetical protein